MHISFKNWINFAILIVSKEFESQHKKSVYSLAKIFALRSSKTEVKIDTMWSPER